MRPKLVLVIVIALALLAPQLLHAQATSHDLRVLFGVFELTKLEISNNMPKNIGPSSHHAFVELCFRLPKIGPVEGRSLIAQGGG